ncbi:unnamed protein product [Nesidiocoris tenuis]|uniref:Uncharacterized protein n=1 Tax=Nesidiocoris tenuis TaxID=355587 RepID=A0A6H5HKK7_9HEMI|nr:unnamed protein product [Nesidiocoris tenuis]
MSSRLKKDVKDAKAARKMQNNGENRLEVVLSDRLQNRPAGNPNFIAFSSLSDDPWSEISDIASGVNILILMKTMRLNLWDSLKKYYGIFQRLGRLDRAIIFDLARGALETTTDQSPYQNVVKNLDSNPDEAQFCLGKIIMSVYRAIVTADGTLSPRELTLPEIMNRLDDGHRAVLKKTKKQYHMRKGVDEAVSEADSSEYRDYKCTCHLPQSVSEWTFRME